MFHRAVLWSRTKTCCYRVMQSSEITSYHIALKAFLWCYIPLCTLKRWKLLCENEKKQKQQILWLKCSDADNSVINLCGFYHSTWLVFTWRPQSDVIMHVYETTTFSWMLWLKYHGVPVVLPHNLPPPTGWIMSSLISSWAYAEWKRIRSMESNPQSFSLAYFNKCGYISNWSLNWNTTKMKVSTEILCIGKLLVCVQVNPFLSHL